MTAQELIGAYDAERPNQIDTGVKLSWIQKVEWKMCIRDSLRRSQAGFRVAV